MSNKPKIRSVLAEKAAAELEKTQLTTDSDWVEILEKNLGRELKNFELGYLVKVEDRWTRYQESQILAEFDLVSIYSKWDVQSYEPLDLWPTPPEDFPQFWGGIAMLFAKRNIKTPDFLEALPGLNEAKDEFQKWERAESSANWSENFSSLSARPNLDDIKEYELKLQLGPDDCNIIIGAPADLEDIEDSNCDENGWKWNVIESPDALDIFAKEHAEGKVTLSDASALIWTELRTFWSEDASYRLDLSRDKHASAVRRLLESSLLHDKILTYEGEPFFRSEDRLQWHCRKPAGENADLDWEIVMGTSSGETFQYPVRLLPGATPIYLGDDSIFQGPPYWGTGTSILPKQLIPKEVVETSSGIDFLSRIQASLPDDLDNRVEDHKLNVTIKANLREADAKSEAVFFQVNAEDQADTRKERFVKNIWEVKSKVSDSDSSALHRYDRTSLMLFPRLLKGYRTSWQEEAEEFRVRLTKPFPLRFSTWAKNLPKDITLETDEELGSILADPIHAEIKVEVDETNELDWFDLRVVVDIQGMDLTTKEIKELVAARGDFVRLKGRGWLRLQLDADAETQEAIKDLGVDAFDVTGKSHRMHALQLVDGQSKKVIDKKIWSKIQNRVETLQTQLKPDPPEGLHKILRPYQKDGFHFLVYLAVNGFGGILADDMGLGKTLQSLSWIAWLRQEAAQEVGAKGKVPPVLVVCPKSVIDVWGEETKRFLPDLRVQLLRNRDELDIEVVKNEVDLLVINYAQLRNGIEDIKQIEFLTSILDEGQQIKNPDSKAAQAASELNTRHRLVLSGTPIENKLLDVWSLMHFAMPGVLGNKAYFKERFDRRKDATAHMRLSSRLRPFLLRRTKGQVATDLPPRIEEEIPCEMEPAQREMYDNELERARELLLSVEGKKDLASKRFNVLSSLLRLRQICCHPNLIDSENEEVGSAKLEALFYHLHQLREEGHKVLVFSQFTSMLDIIRERLESEDREYYLLTGKTENRSEIVKDFQKDPDPKPFLLSLKAGGSGLNLTSASYVILFDPWWNPAVERQAIDRTHRIGQKRPINAYRLVTRNSVEEKIRLLQKQKENLVGDVLSEETFAQNLEMNDLKFILGTEE